ncbi:MAG: hypothetical protein EMLJLAPB_00825 [Candidatus Argoarchaeum ethanivorans]|uniref:Uncharacterized protein n=1 Tax=Candidatus Argoarchaeum ethanivorans TaxID=2608793 RepID=A0A811TFQ4_9EURY|nr:MAG: hypothetical protein FFODKBPE_00456 [Candidatus Argoarchaeum ethanivorans]CAD6494542.1 MAG: hypothetical protein EMLJLAPB_00825 [Candidatus Argoarchaeum ethanivorans]
MKKVEIQLQNRIEIDDIHGFFIRKVTKFGKNLLKHEETPTFQLRHHIM